MKVTNNSGKRIILSLIVVMLLSLIVSSVFVYSIDEKKIRLDELASIKKLVLAERDKSFNTIVERIKQLSSEITSDGKKKNAALLVGDKKKAQELIKALTDSNFLTNGQKSSLDELKTTADKPPEEEKKSLLSSWRLWAAIPLLVALLYILLLRKQRYKAAGKVIGFGFSWLKRKTWRRKKDGHEEVHPPIDTPKHEATVKETWELSEYIDKRSQKIKYAYVRLNIQQARRLLEIKDKMGSEGTIGYLQEILRLDRKKKWKHPTTKEEFNPILVVEVIDKLNRASSNVEKALEKISHDLYQDIQKWKEEYSNCRKLYLDAYEKSTDGKSDTGAILRGHLQEFGKLINELYNNLKIIEIMYKDINNKILGEVEIILTEEKQIADNEAKEYNDLKSKNIENVQQYITASQDIISKAEQIARIATEREAKVYEQFKQKRDEIINSIREITSNSTAVNAKYALVERIYMIFLHILDIRAWLNEEIRKERIIADDLHKIVVAVKLYKEALPEVTMEEFKGILEAKIFEHNGLRFNITVNVDYIELKPVQPSA